MDTNNIHNQLILEDAKQELELMNQTHHRSGYVVCDVCEKFDRDAGGMDYWEWKGKIYCYYGCWEEKKNNAKALVESLKNKPN